MPFSDLRILQERNRAQLKYMNVAAHAVDIIAKLTDTTVDATGVVKSGPSAQSAAEAKPGPSAHSAKEAKLLKDTLEVLRETISDSMTMHVAAEFNHTVWERYQVMLRDGRAELGKVDPVDRATARLVPNDSDDFLFGSERGVLKKLIEEGDLKVTKQVKLVQTTVRAQSKPNPQPSTSGDFRPQGKKNQGNSGFKGKGQGQGQHSKPQGAQGGTIFNRANANRAERGAEPLKQSFKKKKRNFNKKGAGAGDKKQ